MNAGDEPNYTTFVIGGKPVVADVNATDMAPGDRAVVIRNDGEIGVAMVSNQRHTHDFGGKRWALEENEFPAATYAGCLIIGRVVATAHT